MSTIILGQKTINPTINLTPTQSKTTTPTLNLATKIIKSAPSIITDPIGTGFKAMRTAAAVVGLGTLISHVGVGATAAAVIPKTIGGKVAAAVAAPIIVGAVVKEPVATAKAVTSAPKSLANVGGNVATAVADPSKENITNIIKENPKTSAALAVTGLVAAGAAAAGTIGSVLTHQELKQQTAAFERQAAAAEAALISETIPTTAAASNIPNVPLTPATETVEITPIENITETKKPTQNGVIPHISIINKNTSTGIRQTYLNKRIYKKR